MRFHSNSELARHYIKELLSDGEPHARQEILDYVMEQTSGFGIDGQPLTPSMVTSNFSNTNGDWLKFTQPRRGVYQLDTIEIAPTTDFDPSATVERVLENAENEIREAFTLNVAALPDEEIELLRKGCEEIMGYISQARTANLLLCEDIEALHADSQALSDVHTEPMMDL